MFDLLLEERWLDFIFLIPCLEKSQVFSVELVVIQLTVPSSSPLSITVHVPSRWSWSNSRVGKIYVLNIDTMLTEIFYKISNFTSVLGITLFHFDVAAFPGAFLSARSVRI